jgi:hypothetical protein
MAENMEIWKNISPERVSFSSKIREKTRLFL